MPTVIIHEFQIDVEPEEESSKLTAEESPEISIRVGAQEIERVLRRQMERESRVKAH